MNNWGAFFIFKPNRFSKPVRFSFEFLLKILFLYTCKINISTHFI